MFFPGSAQEVQGSVDEPLGFALAQNYPNPFNPKTESQFSIVNTQFTILKVYEVLGREVATLVNERKGPGSYEVRFNADGLAYGMYFYRLTMGELSESRKMLLLK